MQGLTPDEATRLLKEHGPNIISQKRQWSFLKSFLSQFNNFLTLLLVAASIISFFIGEKLDFFFILLIIGLNVFFGIYQEYKSERALQSLKQMVTTMVRVIRGGQEIEVDSRYLVPKDIIYLETGAKIPADAQVLKSWGLEINEAALTGESMPVEKNEKDKDRRGLYAGTVVVGGRCFAEVIKTGDRTRFGQIAKTLSEIKKEKTTLQKKLEGFSKQIGIIGIAASVVVFILSFIQGKTAIGSFVFAVSLAVAAVPEGLPAVLTITLAMGVERMAKRKAIVRKLNTIEALGSITLILTDKTGTLTTNEMRVKKVWMSGKVFNLNDLPSVENRSFKTLLLNGILCSTSSVVRKVESDDFDVIGDPTEGAVLILSHKFGMEPQKIKEEWTTSQMKQFDPSTKKMSVTASKGNKTYLFTKGAPESILPLCSKIIDGDKERQLKEEEKDSIQKEFYKFADEGLRIIAFSYDDVFLGFVGLADPVRPQIKESVYKAEKAGIKVVIVTGDNELTAEAVGIETGIIKKKEDILKGEDIDKYSDNQLISILPKVKIFARTTPEHKYRLVTLYKKLGETVAVTGDGVNDVLALKQADVGIAMGITGTDVAKETADMVITDDNFVTIVDAIEQGRNIVLRIKNATKYLLTCNLAEVIYILFAIIFRYSVFTPLQILYLNLITDGLPAISLAFSPTDQNVMRAKPAKLLNILSKKDFKYMWIVGCITAFLTLMSIIPLGQSDNRLSISLGLTTMLLVQHFILIDVWLSHRPILKNISLLKRPIFLFSFTLPFIVHPFLLYNGFLSKVFETAPLDLNKFLYSLALSVVILILLEAMKIGRKPISGIP